MTCCFFFNDTATTEIYTLSLHDALPIFTGVERAQLVRRLAHRSDALQDILDHARESHAPPVLGRVDLLHARGRAAHGTRSEEHTSELQSPCNLVCRLLLATNIHVTMVAV